MHYQLQAPVAARDPAGRTSVYGLKIPTIGFVSLHAYACPNVNYEVSAQMGQFYGSWALLMMPIPWRCAGETMRN